MKRVLSLLLALILGLAPAQAAPLMTGEAVQSIETPQGEEAAPAEALEERPETPPAEPEAGEDPLAELAATGDWVTVPGIEGGRICFDSSTGTITDCEDTVTTANIPATINGVAVTAIGNYAFRYGESLTSVIIPSSVTSIGYWAFSPLIRSSLVSVTVPGSVTSIGHNAFDGCSNLTSITISEGVTSIGGDAFHGCSSLTGITIPDSVSDFGSRPFVGCESLTYINVSAKNQHFYAQDGVLFGRTFKELICYPCMKPDISYAIPEGVTSIDDSAFEDCYNLTSITIPASVEYIRGNTFMFGCKNLTYINVSAENPYFYMQDGVLRSPKSLIRYPSAKSGTSYTIPEGVASIAYGTFEGCFGLSSVIIPEGVTSIGSYAFKGCSGLSSIIIPEGVASIGSSAFEGCSGLSGVIIPEGVTSIGSSAFKDCSSLTSVTIPGSVTYMHWAGKIFEDCPYLTSAGPIGSGCSIEFGWTEKIPDHAFHYDSSLTSVTIPEGVTSIGNYVFEGFDSNLTSVTIPKSVISIGEWAFANTDNLTDVYYGGSKDDWSNIEIGGVNDHLTSATIHYNTFIHSPAMPDEPVTVDPVHYYDTPEKRVMYIRAVGARYPSPAGFLVKVGDAEFRSGRETCPSTDDITASVPSGYTGNITVSRSGYYTNTIPASLTGAYNYVVMTPTTVKIPFVQTFLVDNSSPSYPSYTNLVAGLEGVGLSVYEMGLTQGAKTRRYYTSINWNGHGVGTVWLEQEGKTISLNNDGFTEFAVESKFAVGKPIYLCAKAGDGTVIKRKTGLKIIRRLKNTIDIDLGQTITAHADPTQEELDILHGEDLSIDLGKALSDGVVPIKFKVKDDGSIEGTIGLQLYDDKYDEAAFGKAKEAVKQLLKPGTGAQNQTIAKTLSELEQMGIMPKGLPHSSFGLKGNVQVLGYFTGKFSNGTPQLTEVKTALVVEGSVTYTHNTYFFTMPAYVKMQLKAELETAIKLKYDETIKKLTADGEQSNTATISLSGETGGGWPGAVSTGVKGKGSLISDFTLPLRNSEAAWSLKGKLSLAGTAGPLSGEWVFWESPEMVFWEDGSPVWYEKGKATSHARFVPDLENRAALMAVSEGNAIFTGVSGYNAPALAALSDGRLLAVWVADVPGRSGLDKNGAYYSVRALDGTWSDPALVWEDGTNDSVPQLCEKDGELLLCWQNYTRVYHTDSLDGIAYDDLSAQMTTALGRFDEAAGAFVCENSAQPDWYLAAPEMPSTYEGEAPITSSNRQVFSTGDLQAVLYTAEGEDGVTDVYGLFNDGYGFGEPVRLTRISDGAAGGFSAVLEGDKLTILVNKCRYDAQGNYAAADLELCEVALAADLAVGEVDYVRDTLVPGQTMTLTADVTNLGAETVSGLTITLSDSTGQLMEKQQQVTLLPGQSKSVYINYDLPVDFQRELTLQVLPAQGSDPDSSDNSGTCTLETADLSLEELWARNTPAGTELTLMAVNRGTTDIQDYTVTYRQDTPEGTVLKTEQVTATLAPGAAEYRTLTLDTTLDEGAMVYVQGEISATENLYGNNSTQAVVVEGTLGALTVSATPVTTGGGATLEIAVQNNGLEDVSCTLIAAAYDQGGARMLEVKQAEPMTLPGLQAGGCSLDFSVAGEDITWKVFALNGSELVPLVAATKA